MLVLLCSNFIPETWGYRPEESSGSSSCRFLAADQSHTTLNGRQPVDHSHPNGVVTQYFPLTQFRWASDGEVIRGRKQGFFLVHFPRWLFFQLI